MYFLKFENQIHKYESTRPHLTLHIGPRSTVVCPK